MEVPQVEAVVRREDDRQLYLLQPIVLNQLF